MTYGNSVGNFDGGFRFLSNLLYTTPLFADDLSDLPWWHHDPEYHVLALCPLSRRLLSHSGARSLVLPAALPRSGLAGFLDGKRQRERHVHGHLHLHLIRHLHLKRYGHRYLHRHGYHWVLWNHGVYGNLALLRHCWFGKVSKTKRSIYFQGEVYNSVEMSRVLSASTHGHALRLSYIGKKKHKNKNKTIFLKKHDKTYWVYF